MNFMTSFCSTRFALPRFSQITLVFFVTALALACGSAIDGPATSNGEPQAVNPTQTDTVSSDMQANAGACSNDYYPIDATLRDYKVSGTAPGAYTLKQDKAIAEGFVEIREFDDGITVTNNWICTPDGLRTAEYNSAISIKEGGFEMETVKSSGVTIPKDWTSGSEWQTEYEVVAKIAAGPINSTADGKITAKNKLVSVNEQIIVDGQDYEAARIDTTLEVDLSMKGQRMKGATVKLSNWYAKGIGLVKQETKGEFGGQIVEFVGKM